MHLAMNKTIDTYSRSPIEAQEKAKALEMIAQHFTGKELLRIAQKLQSPLVKTKIKAFL